MVLIQMFGPVSGAFQPGGDARASCYRREAGVRDALLYMAVQLAGAVAGVWLAHAMFAEPCPAGLGQAARRPRGRAGRGGGDLRPDRVHPGHTAVAARLHARRGGALYPVRPIGSPPRHRSPTRP